MAATRFDDDRLTLMGLLAEAHAGLMGILGPDIERFGLTESEFEVLVRLARSPEHRLRMNDLAAQVGMSTSGLTRLVDRLLNDGFVERLACPTDRRGSFAILTKTGKRRIESAIETHLELIDTWMMSPLDARDRAGLERALRKIRDRVRPGSLAGANGQPA